ncbi:alpha/beta fold hydrolase [Paracoccus sp. M683]|uniref:alpha/beta fold hydrolase n=1 Tax=Paracoccus sp. M683 TaxID=2594268 RepID=UPI001181099C|nr:alpha/beta fold hydrolase [Paracoccus sp. M683]TRW98166.1 alpha/beta fold hydrolase [Paracoccus sp. M683]
MSGASGMNPAALLTPGVLTMPAASLAETVTIEGHEVWYRVQGQLSPDRIPILLLHGGAMHLDSTFGQMLPALAADHVVIGVEQQGHGHTPINDQPITLATMRADTLGVLDALGVQRAHVVGFSAGGMLGLELAVNAPRRVASLTAISASQNLGGFLPEFARMNRDPSFQLSPPMAALMPSTQEFAQMRQDVADLNPGGVAAADQMFAKMSAFIGGDWGWRDDQLAAIAAPVLIVQGDTDFIRRDHALHLAATIPGSWLAILPDTTHNRIMQHPALPGMILHRIATTSPEAP